MAIVLREYQDRGRTDIRACYSARKKAPLYVLPTGGGKTVLYAAIADGAAARGKRVVILEHRKELIRQASLALGGMGVRHQIVAPPSKVAGIRAAHVERLGWPMIDQTAPVVVASVQTLARRMAWLVEFDPDLIVIDEAHHAVAGTWASIIAALPRALLLGVSATPVRADGRGLGVQAGGPFDAMVLGPTMRELIDLGFLAPPQLFGPPCKADLSQVGMRGDDLDPAQQAELLDKPTITGDAVDHYKRVCPGAPAIVFCTTLAHAGHVAEAFRGAGFRFETIHGAMDDADRDRLIYGLASGAVQGLVSVDLIGEGVDIPVASVAILLRSTASEALYLQQVGRVLRPAEGKTHGIILDHVGNWARHGLPAAERSWTLAGRKKRRRGAVEEKPPPISQCPQCYAVHEPASKCPACGHAYQSVARLPHQVDGQLVEITEADADLLARQDARKAQANARTIEDLVANGMTRGRASHIMEARAEKDRLQGQLRELLSRWSAADGRTVFAGFGFMVAEVSAMKPKALRENVERVTEALLALSLPAAAADGEFRIRSSG